MLSTFAPSLPLVAAIRGLPRMSGANRYRTQRAALKVLKGVKALKAAGGGTMGRRRAVPSARMKTNASDARR